MNRFHKMCLYAFALAAVEAALAAVFPALRVPVLALLALELAYLLGLAASRNLEKRRLRFDNDKAGGDYIKLERGYVRYKLTGPADGPLALMINGFPMPYEIWDRNAAELAASGCRVLQFDLLGFGGSERPRANYDTELYCGQIRELLRRLGLQGPVHIVAFSIGCTIAARLVETSPDVAFGKAVLIGPVVNPIPISPFNWPVVGEYLTSLFIQKAMFNIFGGNFHQKRDLDAFKGVFFEQLQYKGFRRAWLSFYRNLFPRASARVYDTMAKAGIPVAVISGREDKIVPLKDSELLHRQLGWPLTLIEDGGHSVQFECGERVNAEIRRFLKEDAAC